MTATLCSTVQSSTWMQLIEFNKEHIGFLLSPLYIHVGDSKFAAGRFFMQTLSYILSTAAAFCDLIDT